nr:hypothetical protein GCM10020093_108710 [Planobispora longispora]
MDDSGPPDRAAPGVSEPGAPDSDASGRAAPQPGVPGLRVPDPDAGARVAARIAARCEPLVNRLTREIVAEQAAAVPAFASLPERVRDLEVAASVRHGLRLFLRGARGEPVTGRDLLLFRERAAQRMTEGCRWRSCSAPTSSPTGRCGAPCAPRPGPARRRGCVTWAS